MRYDAERAEVERVSDASEGRYAGVHRFAALEFLARRVDHIPAKGEVRVRYYGAYASRRRRWAELLRMVFRVELEVCPRCEGELRNAGFVTEHAVVACILAHLERRGCDARAGPWAGAVRAATPGGCRATATAGDSGRFQDRTGAPRGDGGDAATGRDVTSRRFALIR